MRSNFSVKRMAAGAAYLQIRLLGPRRHRSPRHEAKIMKVLFIAILAIVTTAAVASQEGILPLSSFHLESCGIGSSGKVVVDGRQNEKAEILSLKVTAFGKDYVIPKEKLSGLAELHGNGIRISYEAGYPEVGGRTVYIQLQMGFTSHTRMQALITVSEDGKVEVGKIEKTQQKD